MFCIACGARLPDDAAFCMKCGKKLPNETGGLGGTDTTNPVSDALRNIVYERLSQNMLDALETGAMTVEESEDSSVYVLDHLDSVSTVKELKNFLNDFCTRWPI